MKFLRPGFLFLMLSLGLLLCSGGAASAQWVVQPSGATVRFRGVSAVSRSVAWASGEKGTFARTINGGRVWRTGTVPGASELDFRDVDAFDALTAYLLSIGPGDKSRIYKTTDGGQRWTLQFTSSNPKAFFDAMAFWDKRHGIAMSDPVDGRFVIITTDDGGATWRQMPSEGMPTALAGEGAFAASGTCITVEGKNNVWFGTGGGAQARVFHSTDRGRTWTASPTPLASGHPPAGIFSLAFKDERNGIAVGGDYQKETDPSGNAAITTDGGRTWTLVTESRPNGYRSCVVYVPRATAQSFIAVGPSGADYSADDGRSWSSIGPIGFHSVSFAAGTTDGWAVGEKGLIAKYEGALGAARRTRTERK